MDRWTSALLVTVKRKNYNHAAVLCSASVLSYSLWPHGLQTTRLLCPWNSPSKNPGVGSHSLLQEIFPTQGLNPGLPHCRQILHHLSQGSPYIYIYQLINISVTCLGEGNGNPLQFSCLENPVDRGAWWAAVHRVAQSRTRLKQLSMHACIGEGNGNPLQCSCLENPRDRGAWRAAVCGVTQSRTWLKSLSSSSRMTCLDRRKQLLNNIWKLLEEYTIYSQWLPLENETGE